MSGVEGQMTQAGVMDTISKRHEVDPVFAEVCAMVYGDAVDVREVYDQVSKAMPDSADLNTHAVPNSKPRRRKFPKSYPVTTVMSKSLPIGSVVGATPQDRSKNRKIAATGMAATTVALTGGLHAVKLTAGHVAARRAALKEAKGIGSVVAAMPKTKLAGIGAAAGAGWGILHATELGADALSYRANAKAYKANMEPKAKTPVIKSMQEILNEVAAPILEARREGQISTTKAIEMIAKAAESIETNYEVSKWSPMQIARDIKGAVVGRDVFAVPPIDRLKRLPKAANLVVNPVARANSRAENTARVAANAIPARRAAFKMTALTTGATAGGFGYHEGKKKGRSQVVSLAKADDQVDYTFVGEISKMDEHKRLAFGWCHLSEVDGQPHYDLQGDYAPIEEIEKSAYAYVLDSRKGGDMHTRDGDRPVHTADLVESMVVTPEKLSKMGLSPEVAASVPTGWWIGMKVKDDKQWAQVLSGERTGFSVHGKGNRVSKVLEEERGIPHTTGNRVSKVMS